MSDKLSSQLPGAPTPTVSVDSDSVVSTREIKNAKAKSLSVKIETERDAENRPSGGAIGQRPQADYTASGGSVICADKICDVTIDGDIDLSVSVKRPQGRAGAVEEPLPSSKGPAVKMITEHKVELIDCLMGDHSFILQHVHAKHIVTDREYQNMKHSKQPEETVTNLIDQVILKGQESCSRFLEILKKPEVLRTFPQLKQITTCAKQ
ncbi:uncharacterized protein [Chaetodon trifascialis]|uniref:uncharacterized protein n=1 Tax=Chaetodon trifascialis TaxID=109706 RepID=UPI0039957A00